MAAHTNNRETSFNRCDGSSSLGAGKTVEITHYGGTSSQGLSSCLSVSCRVQALGFPENLVLQHHSLWEPHPSLSVKKASCNLLMVFRMMRTCTCQSLPAPLTKTHPSHKLLSLFSPKLVTIYFLVGAHHSLPALYLPATL